MKSFCGLTQVEKYSPAAFGSAADFMRGFKEVGENSPLCKKEIRGRENTSYSAERSHVVHYDENSCNVHGKISTLERKQESI
ncbi:uncharacterized protein LOC113681337 isoform X2 [Pocillopora damicornis]|uniref:uncharacterized protein LOC113681337 isoform X2 n=1 Tax=Pocillopora damicornis TaxID=46731 RepID=UPI000F55042A|nr:uncharacterized protein LOC113681337 isoform X2 [Pocillopora damicornis]